jgi:AraC-like DNA-binding protein
MLRSKQSGVVGLLRPLADPNGLTRYEPSSDLAPFVEHHWIVRWNLDEGAEHVAETLPHPCVHLVVERGASGVFGIVRGRFRKRILGRGRAAAIRFRPGGFAAIWPRSIRAITGRVVPLDVAFGHDGAEYERAVLEAPDDDATHVALAEAFVRSRSPHADDDLALVTRAMALVDADSAITRVDALAHELGIGVRTLQRLFADRVGVSPKWVICRARLQQAAARVMAGEAIDWTRLALELGYYDQPHLAAAYRSIIGVTPAEHARRLGDGRRDGIAARPFVGTRGTR